MEQLLKFFGGVMAIVIMVIASFFVSLLITHIMLDIAILYDVKMISALSFKQLFGAIYLFGILTMRLKTKFDSENSDSFSEQLVKGFGGLIAITLTVLLSWWFAHIFYKFL